MCAIGSGGWEVLCECAQCVLRACRNAAAAASKVGKHALEAPADASAALDEAGSRKGLGKRADRAVRQLMEAMTLALRQGRCSTLAASLCAAKAGEAASLILSLAKLPPSGSRLTAAVGAPQLASLMSRVSEVLSDMAAAVSDAADHAMATATAACDVVRKAESVRELVAAAGGSKSDVDSSSDGSDSEEGDENVREARRKAEADARERAEAEARAQEAASEDGGAAAAAAREVQRAIAEAPPAVQKRVTNARWLRKLAVEMAEMQGKMRELCTISPQLLPGVGIGQKEELFELLSEVWLRLHAFKVGAQYAGSDALHGVLCDSTWCPFVLTRFTSPPCRRCCAQRRHPSFDVGTAKLVRTPSHPLPNGLISLTSASALFSIQPITLRCQCLRRSQRGCYAKRHWWTLNSRQRCCACSCSSACYSSHRPLPRVSAARSSRSPPSLRMRSLPSPSTARRSAPTKFLPVKTAKSTCSRCRALNRSSARRALNRSSARRALNSSSARNKCTARYPHQWEMCIFGNSMVEVCPPKSQARL